LARQLARGEEIHEHAEALALDGDVTLERDAAQLMARTTGETWFISACLRWWCSFMRPPRQQLD
jgi:hypothetical protein